MKKSHKPTVLIILDGWGYREAKEGNAIACAQTPTWDRLWHDNPHALISGSGPCVGLPSGQMGNSEVGHLNIGSGRVVPQDFTRIAQSIKDDSFFNNPVFINAMDNVIAADKAIHIFGLLSPGGVHSHEEQIHALLELTARLGAKKVYIHAFLDGRDTPPRSAESSFNVLQEKFQQLGVGKIASIIGRYYAMDRDKRWDRVEQAYDLLTQGKCEFTATSAVAGLTQAYARGENDEFVKATTIHAEHEKPVTVNDGDAVFFMNYRADRARQLTRAFVEKDFNEFQRKVVLKLDNFITLTRYAADIHTPAAYPPVVHQNVLGEIVAKQQLRQLRIAETEKYAHVTFFFNGGVEVPFPGEDRELIPSPKVATYDLKPEMSAFELTEKLVAAIESGTYSLIICNYANADMVGHSGDLQATIKAVEAIDSCLLQVDTALKSCGGEMLITADHGNAEIMENLTTQQAHTAHTSEPVPLLYVGRPAEIVKQDGILADIAPSILHLMNLEQPAEMTGQSIIKISKK